jgi:hypothetical protein
MKNDRDIDPALQPLRARLRYYLDRIPHFCEKLEDSILEKPWRRTR